jgi:hypothetical protein
MIDQCDRIFWIRDGLIDKIQNRSDITVRLAGIEEK